MSSPTETKETPRAKLRLIVDCPTDGCPGDELEIVDLPKGQNVEHDVTCGWCEGTLRVPAIWVKA